MALAIRHCRHHRSVCKHGVKQQKYDFDKKFVSVTHPVWLAHWAEPDYGLSAGQHAVLPEGKGHLVWPHRPENPPGRPRAQRSCRDIKLWS